ncbi:conserved Plasmodium protein, unknown function [Plasmodium ovale]|uniref:HTH OST-type domain-containing protein n=1 Tax=Plasmodium ovale TaxID=36330 RepID=A0A1D3TLU1_PLAOA|nr:conserved Plasmodium protein, unknown function [Plasmodium ovale]
MSSLVFPREYSPFEQKCILPNKVDTFQNSSIPFNFKHTENFYENRTSYQNDTTRVLWPSSCSTLISYSSSVSSDNSTFTSFGQNGEIYNGRSKYGTNKLKPYNVKEKFYFPQNGGDFNGGNFNGGNFKGGNFNEGNFKGGNFKGGNFKGGNFKGGNFKGGYFGEVDFREGCYNQKIFNDNIYHARILNDHVYHLRDFREGHYYPKEVHQGDVNEQNFLRFGSFEINNFGKNYKKYEYMKSNCNVKRGLKKNCLLNDKYSKIKKDIFCNGDLYIKNLNKNYSCTCLNIYRQIYKDTKYDIFNLKKIHTDFIYIIIKYLYYECILPEANEIKRKINKYFPDCIILNNNFINLCREDIERRFEICRTNSYEKDQMGEYDEKDEKDQKDQKDEKRGGKIFYKKPFNNENVCIYLKNVSKEFFINPNDDCENISLYIPLIFIHIIDRFRIQSPDNNHKGGRYILAEMLKRTGPYIFRTMKLGKIIHILQKCIDLNVLSYCNNNIIPIFTSMSISKTFISKMHVNQNPDLRNYKKKSINLIKNRISHLLYSYSEDKSKAKGFSLSRLPLIYKNVYKENINIDQIGYSKLTEFINNEMSDICFISTQHKFQCILLPVMEDEQKHRDKNAKLKKETVLWKCLDYIKNYQWERCISFLHTSNCLKNKDTDFELEYGTSNSILEELMNDSFFLEYKENADTKKEDTHDEEVPLLLPLDVFNLPSSYDMYDSYYKSCAYYSKDETDDTSVIKFVDTSQNKFDIICDFEKCENTNICIEESIGINHMYFNFPSSYHVFHSLFNDNVEDVPIVDHFRIQC